MSGKIVRSVTGILVVATLLSCGGSKQVTHNNPDVVIEMPALEISTSPSAYNPSEPKVNDLLHTRLDIRFDWQKHHLLGVATMDFKPYFYPTNKLILDAKGFDINRVSLVTDTGFDDLDYLYDGWSLTINLNKTYSRIETYTIRVDYVAKPDDLPIGGSQAILADKGLYFINTDSTEVDKPTQIWTQGQTESSSCWFPTIDSPNERMTQEMFITVEEKYRTLSNGEHVYSNYNADGSRTDFWKMDKSHPPYLVMMAVGDFVVAHDKWVNSKGEEIPVNYYVEPEFGDYAYRIFGNTPEMMSFYSQLLNVDYPWPKYSQVIVRDYVSGAMENTTATIHGEFLNMTDRELLDYTNEDIIAHELFHHWFGDLVTCENWANLALNESFATYGEYLWADYKYGYDEAQITLDNFKESYIMEASFKQENLIRYYYDDKEDMFDSHTYEKGACILHMLRQLVGDDAFFDSLHEYLVRYSFQDAEVHKLRLVFEEVTGLDLQWFFDQWFLGSGHPELEVHYDLNNGGNIVVNQTQSSARPFRLPVQVDVHYSDHVERLDWVIADWTDTLALSLSASPTWIKFDPNYILLADLDDDFPTPWYLEMGAPANHVMDRLNAFSFLEEVDSLDDESAKRWKELVLSSLNDPFDEVQTEALSSLETLFDPEEFKPQVIALIANKNTSVASTALRTLGDLYDDDKDLAYFYNGLRSKSYYVMAASLRALAVRDSHKGLVEAEHLRSEQNPTVKNAVNSVFAIHGDSSYRAYFENEIAGSTGYQKYKCLSAYGNFLQRQDLETIQSALPLLETWIISDDFLVSVGARDALRAIARSLNSSISYSSDSSQPEMTVVLDRVNSILKAKPE
jgi:aminopeptidase N